MKSKHDVGQCFSTRGPQKPIKGSAGQGIQYITINLVMSQFIFYSDYTLYLNRDERFSYFLPG